MNLQFSLLNNPIKFMLGKRDRLNCITCETKVTTKKLCHFGKEGDQTEESCCSVQYRYNFDKSDVPVEPRCKTRQHLPL